MSNLTHQNDGELTKLFDNNTYIGYIDEDMILCLFDEHGCAEEISEVLSVTHAFDIIRSKSSSQVAKPA